MRTLAADFALVHGLENPRYTIHEGRVVLISALPYGRQPLPESGGMIGGFARKNYYRELIELLRELTRILALPEARVFCNSRLPERSLAVRSGLGSRGRNGLVFLPGRGSLFVLGGIQFPDGVSGQPDPPSEADLEEVCGGCRACLSACPTGALDGDGGLDSERCLQAWAGRDGVLPEEIIEKWGGLLYGCDACQDCCPENGNPPPAAKTERGRVERGFDPAALASASDADLARLLKPTALGLSWLPKQAIRRNAFVAAANLGIETLEPAAAAVVCDPSAGAGLRQAAAYYLSRTGGIGRARI